MTDRGDLPGLCDLPTDEGGHITFLLDVTWRYGTKPQRFTITINSGDFDPEHRTPICLLMAALESPGDPATGARDALRALADRDDPERRGDTWATIWCSIGRVPSEPSCVLFDGPGEQAWDELAYQWTLEERATCNP